MPCANLCDMQKRLKENSTLELTGSKYRVRLITEGQGSSGFYAAEMLESCGPTAFPKGTFLYFNHQSPDTRDVRDAFGVLAEDAAYDEKTKGLWADADIFEQHRGTIKELSPYADLSIEAAGELDEHDNVTEISVSPWNAVALVPRGGRDGKMAEIIEKASCDNLNNNDSLRKDKGMTPEDIQKIAEAVSAALADKFTALAEVLKPAPEVEDDKDKVDPLGVAEALVEAGLPKSARVRVMESVKAGKEIAEAITAEKTYISEINEEAGKVGRIVESDKNYTVGGW